MLVCLAACHRGNTSGTKAETTALRPDVLLITIDTLRADRVGICGGTEDVTPAIDALGRAGAAFVDATAHAPLTFPSHASILTGRYPTGHGVHDNSGYRLAADVPTLATVLKRAGYQTAAFVSSYVLRGSTGLDRGFDRYDDRFVETGRSHVTASDLERRGTETARSAADWIAKADGPFFAWVHLYDPHAPYDPPPAFAARFKNRPYDGEVAAADFAVSQLVAALKPERRSRTLVVITGDHGESLGEHGEPEHGVLLYDSTLRVPLVIAGPGVRPGTVVRRQVRHVDLVPTILDFAGVPSVPGLDGEDLRPVVAGALSEPPLSYAESRFGELHFGWHPLRSARDGTWKYIDGAVPELYRVETDPAERTDVSAARADTVVGMARALSYVLARSRAGSQESPALAAEAAQRLRSLGYVAGRVDLAAEASSAGDPRREIGRYVAYVDAFNRGLAALETGRQRDAEERFRDLARSFPRSYEAHQYLGRALSRRHANAAAIAEFDAAAALAPAVPDVDFDAARALAEAGRFEEAFTRVEKGRALDPSSTYGAMTEGLVARAAGNGDRARRAFDEALKLNPSLAVAHLELARAAEMSGDRTQARIEYRRALDGDPDLGDARTALERLSR